MRGYQPKIGQMLRVALLATSTGLTAMGWTAPAFAQETAASTDEAEPIVITGSRIARRDYTATSPIVTVDTDLIDKSSSVNLEANLNKLPQFAPAITQFADATGRGDIQANVNNTLGATTVSLRQLGSNRNLVLVDGRRPTPINGTGVVDINAIPSAAIERVEVITGGASSTYGADAVGGVVNFILKKDFRGITVDAQAGISQEGDGREVRIATLMGASFDDGRGNVILGLEHYDRQAIYQADRKAYRNLYSDPQINGNTIFSFEQDYITFAQGIAPNQATINAAFDNKTNYNTGQVGRPNNTNVSTLNSFYLNDDNSLFINTSVTPTGGSYTPQLLGYAGQVDGVKRKLAANGNLRDNYLDQFLSTPQTRWSFFAKARYDITDDITAFTQATFVKTRVYTKSLVPPAISTWGVLIPHGSYTYAGNSALSIPSSLNTNGTTNAAYVTGGKYGLSCASSGGCTATQVFPIPTVEMENLLNARIFPLVAGESAADTDARRIRLGCGPIVGAPGAVGSGANCPFQINKYLTQVGERYTDNQNVTFQMIAGLEGKVPGTDWTWEIYGSHGETIAKTDQYNFASVLRWRAVLSAPNYGKGFSYKGNSDTIGTGFQGATGTCTSGVSPFTVKTWTDDCRNAVKLDLQNENRVIQDMAEFNLQGGLFNLPYGQLRFALGADYRKNSIKFKTDSMSTEGQSFLEPVNGIYPQGNTQGSINAKEVYGELLVPLLSDLPLIQALNLELGYRLSDYSTVGTVSTYKINGEYAPFKWLRFRGGYQKASRAPNLGELYTSATSTLAPAGSSVDGDPCSRAAPSFITVNGTRVYYGANPLGKTTELAPDASDTIGNPDSDKVEALCRQLMGADGAAQFYRAGRSDYPSIAGGFGFPTLLGNKGLKQEDATTYTIGAVITSPIESPWFRRFSLAIDYYNVVLANAISQQSTDSVMRQCFAKAYNPNFELLPICQFVHRNGTSGEATTVDVTYSNGGRVETSGVDAQLTWALNFQDAGIPLPGTYTISVQGNYLLHFKTQTDPIAQLYDWAGSLGGGAVGTNAGSYRWKLFTTFTYAVGPATLSVQWQHKPAVQSSANREVEQRGATITNFFTGAPSYNLFNLSGTVAVVKGATLRFGIDNLFNKQPPLFNRNLNATGAILAGGNYDNGNYDILGRRFYIGANFKL